MLLSQRAWLSLLLLFGACSLAGTYSLSQHYHPGSRFMQVRLLGTVAIPPLVVDGFTVGGLSALGWDADEQVLYALSDHAALFHLHPRFQDGQLNGAEVAAAYPLRNPDGSVMAADSEGLTLLNSANGVRGDSQLLISFERVPRLQRFGPQGAVLENADPLPKALRDISRYHSPNKALEAVTLHPRYGIITTPEYPLHDEPPGYLTLYSSHGDTWQIPAQPDPNSAVVELETLPNGSLLLLERAFVTPWQPLIISLRQVTLGALPQVREVARFDNSRGWKLDNFEGLSGYQDGTFFIVSDDNFNPPLQQTLLSYFELLPP